MDAIGTYIPPVLIYPRQRMNEDLMTGAPFGSVAFAQEKGWMTSEIFCKWLKRFVRYTKLLMRIGSFYYWMATAAIKVSMLCSLLKKIVLLFFASLSIGRRIPSSPPYIF
nr:unnamed protein product [Callosobruchus analis]